MLAELAQPFDVRSALPHRVPLSLARNVPRRRRGRWRSSVGGRHHPGTLGAFRRLMPALTTCTVYHGPRTTPDASDPRWRPADELFAKPPGDEAGVLVVDASMLEHMGELGKLPRRVVFVAADETAQTALGRRARVSIAGLSDPLAIRRVIDAACLLACARLTSVHLRQRIARHKEEFREMGRISMSLMLERDRHALLRRIIEQGKRLTGSDASSATRRAPKRPSSTTTPIICPPTQPSRQTRVWTGNSATTENPCWPCR